MVKLETNGARTNYLKIFELIPFWILSVILIKKLACM